MLSSPGRYKPFPSREVTQSALDPPHNVWLFNSACRRTAILKSLSSSAERNGVPEKLEDELAVDGLCRRTAILKSLSSSADNNDEPGKEEDEHALAVDGLRLGNLIAYSSSKMCFFGFTNLSLACSSCDFNSCSPTATFHKFTTLCLGGSFPLHLF